MKIISILFVAMLCFVSSVHAGQETPKEGIKSIIALFQAKDFDTLIRERYSEIYKAQAVGKVDELINRVTKRFSNQKRLARSIQVFKRALDVEPEIMINPAPRETETDKMASFNVQDGPVVIYLQKSGKWGIHM